MVRRRFNSTFKVLFFVQASTNSRHMQVNFPQVIKFKRFYPKKY